MDGDRNNCVDQVLFTHIHEDDIKKVSGQIFDLETRFPRGNAVRLALYRARIALGAAMAHNRENKDWPQDREVKADA